MNKDLAHLIERANKIQMSPSDQEAQRRSFAYGNSKIENNSVTREMIDAAADRLTHSE